MHNANKNAVYCQSSRINFKKRSENSKYQEINYAKFRESLKVSDFDRIRLENAVYEYLCRLEEARLWIQESIQENLPQSTELELRLRNGVYLAKLGNFIAPHVVPVKKIFDEDQKLYNVSGLHYRHTDNINYWILAMKAVGLPSYFYPNSFDVYGKKNMPKAIYCLHALNLYLYRCGKGIKIIDLIGKIKFSPEEILSVSREFQKYGIQLPAFSKIGGILSHEVAPNDAPLHAAIIAINIAICQQNHEHLLAALKNPNAQLRNVFKQNAKAYQKTLLELKSQRASDPKNKFQKNELCWDFLTHEIIQEEIDSVNTRTVLMDLKNAALSSKIKEFITILQNPVLNISDVIEENFEAYVTMFEEAINDNGNEFLHITQVQSLISTVNYNAFKCHEINCALTNFNNILENDDYCASYNILKFLVSETHLHDLGRQFYHLQLKKLKDHKGNSLNLQDIQECLPKLTALLDVSIAIIQSDIEETYKALSNSVIKCWDLNVNLRNEYFNALKALKNKKDSDFISIELIKDCITDVNEMFKLKECSAVCTKSISYAITQNNENLLINSLLEHPCILCVDPKHKNLYLDLFQAYKHKHPEHGMLSHDEIQNQINIANKLASDAKYYCACLTSINMAIDKKDCEILFNSLKILSKNESLCFGCKEKYLSKLTEIKTRINEKHTLDKDSSCSSWLKWDVTPQSMFCLNLKTLETAWNQDCSSSLYLCKEHIVETVNEVQKECQCLKYETLESFIIPLQAHIRGFLVRKNLSYKKLASEKYTNNHILAAVKLQSFVRMSFVRKKYLQQKSEKLRLHTAAKRIQRHWRAFKINQNLNILAHSSNPPLSLMQKIIYMLEISNDDYSEEFQLHTLKGKAVQSIRYNQSLIREIDEMDIKIGLLIRNRITLEELLKQKKKTKKIDISERERNNHSFIFSKKYNSLIESFENLLYLLQTKPIYFARLIILLPSNQATTLIESVIFSLYNFGSTPREEYFLLKMLSLTLEEDIKQKGDNLSDIIKGENIIMKIIISFYRKNYWRDCLKALFQPLVLEVLNDKTNLYNLDPVEIYKVWQNELETQTGKKSSMPYEITAEDALCHTEVNNRFNQYMDDLLKFSLRFCEVILNNQSLIPYGMMYISKILKISLQKKFPTSSNEELLKIVGNFLYYRYINPAIIAPEVFDIITTQYNEQLADYERLKLSAIAKFLHFSVTGKKYTEETDYLMCLNPYISDCHEKLMSFFEDVCEVQSLEEYFNIDIFSEAIVNIPEVYMSLNELQTLYKLIKEREYDLAPDSNDVLHEIIEDFDNSFEEICGISSDFLNTEICLSLKNKYELEVEDETEEEKMYVETKLMIIALLQVFFNVDSITDLYKKEPTLEEEMQFEKLCFTKRGETDFSLNWIKMSHNWKTLAILQSALESNLNSLELASYVTSSNNYQEILNNIAKDIVNRWRYRTSRKKDIQKLREIQKQLDSKTVYYLEKLDYYYKYIAACLENMKIGKQNSKFFSFRHSTSNELKYKKTIKCSGSKLHEKGILLAIKNLDVCQFKNIMFEINPTEDLGIFTVNAKFMDIPLETVNIDIQELLNKQYRGIAEMNMFEHVKINNNLLLHFLNSKFYGKNIA